MAEQAGQPLHTHRAQEVFEELRAAGKSNEEIFVAVYQDLKLLAQRMLGRQPAGNSMHASRLLSDLWMRKFNKTAAEFDWESGAHFFNSMARAMRQLLIDHARQRKALIRGKGDVASLDDLIEIGIEAPQDPAGTKNKNWLQDRADQALALEQSFRLLEADNPRQATIVELRVYGGLSEAETAQIVGVSSETVTKEFAKAKRRLAYYLKTSDKPAEP
jgi:RNA polymerase sigma factor (TIGR02999 family)